MNKVVYEGWTTENQLKGLPYSSNDKSFVFPLVYEVKPSSTFHKKVRITIEEV